MSSNAEVTAQAYRLQVRILHLSRLTPRFLSAGDGQHRFSPVLFDFRYFTDTAAAEARVDGSRHLQSLEQEMQEGYGVFLAKLWGLYTSIVQLQQQALALLSTPPQDVESQQTMIALLGSVMLLLDKCISSLPRERSIVAHIRLNSSSQVISNQAPAVVRLFAATGYAAGRDRFPAGYPEQFLARCKLPKAPLRSIIAQGSSSLPSVLHASAQQLYIVLYFLPEALHGDTALMKAVVAQHFSHSWVLPWAPGHFADVSLHWQGYRAARNALGTVVTPTAARQLAAAHGATALPLQRRRTQQFQDNIANGTQGLDSLPELLSCITANNTVLRWLLLHTSGHHRGKQATAVAKQAVDQEAVIGLLLDTAALEHWVRVASSESMQHQWAAHCHSISTKLAYAADLALSPGAASLRDLAEQAAQMPVADVKAVEQLQLALEALQSSSSPSASSSPGLPAQHSTAQHESGSDHHLPTDVEATQLRSPPSSPHPRDTCPANKTLDEPDLAVLGAYSSPSQNPFPDSSQPSPPLASAGVGGWNPWADDLNRRSLSSPHYQPGSSDSNWDDADPLRDHSDDPDPTQDHPPRPTAAAQAQEGVVMGAIQVQDPSVASSMAEAQHRLDQLVGLATSHSSDVEQTLAWETDLGYAWGLVDKYIEPLQRQIRTDPAALPKFSALIFKLRSVMWPSLTALGPMALPPSHSTQPQPTPPPTGLGLEDSKAAAAEVVGYFTAGLLNLTQSVLQVIPALFLKTVEVVCAMHETHALSLPHRPEKARLREYAHLPQRAELAQLTQQLTAYAGNLKAFDSACVAPQQHNTMKALGHAIAIGIARRISQLLTHRMTFSHAPGGVLVAAPPLQGGGLLSGVTAAFGGSSGELVNRGELSTQLSQLAAELHTLKTSFETMQDFVQLPLVFIWQQQLARVVHQALARELSSLPHSLKAKLRQQQAPLQGTVTMTHHTQSAQLFLPIQAATMTHQLSSGHAAMPRQAALPDQARQYDRSSIPNPEGTDPSGLLCARTRLKPTSAEQLRDSALRGHPGFGPLQSDALLSQQPARAQSAVAQEVAHGHEEEHQASVPALPVEAMARLPSTQPVLPSTAGQARLPRQATSRGLPNQATPAAQPTFLRKCLAEVLRLTDPAQSQFQPLLCGWYTSGGVELLGVRGCRALRQALGLAGVRALDKLLQARMNDALQLLSAALSSSNTDTLSLETLGAVLDPAPQPGSGLAAIPDPAAFKEAVRSGGKLWPLLCHYLAPVGQACLIRQRLASELRTAQRLLVPGHASASSERSPSPVQQPCDESSMPAAHKDSQAWAATDVSSQTSQVLRSPANQEMGPPLEPASQDTGLPLEPAGQHLGTSSQPMASASQDSDASSPAAAAAVRAFDTSNEPAPAASQEVPSASQSVVETSSHSGAASQEASAASQLPNAPLEPLQSASQQPGTESANRRTDSGSQPGASVKAPDQASDQGLYSASLHSGSQAGVMLLLCILSLMPRCSFNARLGILERQGGSAGLPDISAVVQGLAVWLQSQDKQHLEVMLHTANQYISAYTQVVTSTTALSVQAAGIQIGLPAEIGRLLAFLEQTVEASGKGRQSLNQFLPPFLLDNWQCLVLSEKSL